jgi:hypothetical protein
MGFQPPPKLAAFHGKSLAISVKALCSTCVAISRYRLSLKPSAGVRRRKNHCTSAPKLNLPEGGVLDTPRHIFAEEIRREGELNSFELAALLGQSALTDQAYYGSRLANADRGHIFPRPRPWLGDADDIMKWDEIVNPRKKPVPAG